MRKRDALLLLGLLAGGARLPGADIRLADVRERIAAMQPFRVEFSQQVFIDGEKEAEESGFILFHDPTLLRWEYTRPERKVFLLANGRFQFFQPENRQLLRGRLDTQREKLLWQLLATDSPGVAYTCDATGIAIHSETGDGPLDLRITIGADGLPARAEQTDPSGVQQLFVFHRYRGRLATRPADFTLAIPPGTEIVDE